MGLQAAGTRWTSLSSLRVLWLCCWLVFSSWPEVVYGSERLPFVIEGNIVGSGVTNVDKCRGVAIKVGCAYKRADSPDLSKIYLKEDGNRRTLTEDESWSFLFFEGGLSYQVSANDATGTKTYECVQEGAFHTTVTIHYDQTGSCSGTTPPTSTTPSTDDTTSPATSSSSEDSSSSSGGSTGSGTTSPPTTSFKGLKPLIYTVASVILLGTLAIVAIITCWIRARRSFHSQIIRPNNTPQDYLDYISDNEFTPLTTSEFLASLQERPPTYNQSEEMSQPQTEDEGEGPPPLSSSTSSSAAGRSAHIEQDEDTTTNQSSQTGDRPTLVVERRRRSRGGSAERRRRRRVVIVEGRGSEPQETTSATAVTSSDTQQGGNEEVGGATNSEARPTSQSAAVSSTESEEIRSTAQTEDVPVQQLIPLDPLPEDQLHHTPSHQEIGVIEARINMVESLSPPPISEHPPATPTAPETPTSGSTSDNLLIDFSSSPPPPPPSSIFTSLSDF